MLCFICRFLNKSNKVKVEKVFSWLILVKECYDKTKYSVISVHEPLFQLLFDGDELNVHRSNVILVNSCDFKKYHNRWCVLKLSKSDRSCERVYLFIPSSRIPVNFVAVLNCNVYNIKKLLKIPTHSVLRDLIVSITVCEDFSPPEANKIVIHFFKSNIVLPVGVLTKIFSNFLRNPRFLCQDDLYCLDMHWYYDVNEEGLLFFKVNQVESSNSHDYYNMYKVTDSTSIFDKAVTNDYMPPKEWQLLEPNNLLTVTTLLPLGLENFYCVLLKWFQPFFTHTFEGK